MGKKSGRCLKWMHWPMITHCSSNHPLASFELRTGDGVQSPATEIVKTVKIQTPGQSPNFTLREQVACLLLENFFMLQHCFS